MARPMASSDDFDDEARESQGQGEETAMVPGGDFNDRKKAMPPAMASMAGRSAKMTNAAQSSRRPWLSSGGAEGIRTPDPLTASQVQRIPTGPGSSLFVPPVWGFAEPSPRSIPARPVLFAGIRDQDVISRIES